MAPHLGGAYFFLCYNLHMTEKINNPPHGNEYYTENEKKIIAIEKAVEADRPRLIDFIGKRYYNKEYIDKANKELSDKLRFERDSSDEAGKLAEWEFTYALGHGETLPGCRASLASEYDDHLNGIDIICKLSDDTSKPPHVFGIDICTATLPDAVSKKFARGDHTRGDIPPGCSFIKFYKDNSFVACMKGVPRFILGASPLFIGHQKYLDNFHLDEEGSIYHTPDPDLQFNILSSLFIQSNSLADRLRNETSGKDETIRNRAIQTCDAVQLASRRALHRLIGIKEGENFIDSFNTALLKAQKLKVNGCIDSCYYNILDQSLKH